MLCDHDAATAVLADALALAERRGTRGPQSADDCRAWLYALARWSCLRRLAEARRRRQPGHAVGRDSGSRGYKDSADRRAAEAIGAAPVSEETEEERRRELARLAWPEAAGTTPEQREALELAVRHQLAAPEVAAVLGMDLAVARELLASAACEVERTAPPSPSSRPAPVRASPASPATIAWCSAPPCAVNSSGTSTTARAAAVPPSARCPEPGRARA